MTESHNKAAADISTSNRFDCLRDEHAFESTCAPPQHDAPAHHDCSDVIPPAQSTEIQQDTNLDEVVVEDCNFEDLDVENRAVDA